MVSGEARLNSVAANGFRLSPEQEEILDQADRFAAETFFPLQQKMDDEEWWPPQTMPELARMGFLGVTVPPELGGAGSDFFTSGLITQGLARRNPSIALSYIAHETCAPTTSRATARTMSAGAICRGCATAARSALSA